MTLELIENLRKEFMNGLFQIMEDYTNVALLINSCHLAIERYSKMEKDIHLSTTANIPLPLRLSTEIETTLNKENLVEKYSGDTQKLLFKQYLVSSIAIFDSIFEECYEILISENEEQLTEKQIGNKVRTAWSNDNLITYFLDKTQLQLPNIKTRRIKEAFDRYKELRIIRHSIVHNQSILSDKHIRQLDELYNQGDAESKNKSLKNSPFYKEGEVNLDINRFLSIRKFIYDLMMYFDNALMEEEEKIKAPNIAYTK